MNIEVLKDQKIKILSQRIGEKIGRKEGKEEGAKDKAIEMARVMKKGNEPIEKISAYTGLSKKEIENLSDI